MSISIRDQKILNDFPKTQPALQRLGEVPSNANMPLGDFLVAATSMASYKCTYSFAKNGAIPSATSVIIDTAQLPVGAIISSLVMEVITPIAQGTASPVGFNLCNSTGSGSQVTFQSIPAADFASAGIKQYVPSTVLKASSANRSIGLASLQPSTAGVVNFYVTYVNPAQAAK
jgi:hypothetical protein